MSNTFPFNFISIHLFVLNFAMKFKDDTYKSHWNILVFFDLWKVTSDLNMFHEKMSDFVSLPLFGFTWVKLRNFDFESRWNTLIFFYKKYDVIFDYVLSNCLIWFRFRCLSRTLATSWEIRISNFIEIV